MDRERFNYKVHLIGDADNTPIVHEISNYWSPNYEGVEEELMRAARAERFLMVAKRQTYTALSVEQV